MVQELSVGQYLLQRLKDNGIDHVFGVPGDYILGLYDLLAKSDLNHIGTTREDTAAFAADGYARCRGIGCLMVTYGVGALNVVNATAGAFAESSPVVVISGAPGLDEQQADPLIHHKFGPFNFQREIFERITCATEVLSDPLTAFRQIDRALSMARTKHKPVYIEVPRDLVNIAGTRVPVSAPVEPSSDPSALEESVNETISLLEKAESPALLTGVELHRSSLQESVVELVRQLNVPVASTLTGKSVLGERHPSCLGVYEGAMGSEQAKQVIENADLVLILGVRFNDVDLGIYTAQLDPYRIVRLSHDEVFIRHHRFQNVRIEDFIRALTEKLSARNYSSQHTLPAFDPGPVAEDFPQAQQKLTTGRMIGRVNTLLPENMTVVADVGDCLFASIDLRVHQRTQFLASAYYTSMGFATPAALGVHCAGPDRRALILVGDGAFQMTGTELSTMVRHGFNPVVIVFNNRGYTTERFILEGPFNDIMNWNFHEIGKLFGPVDGYDVHTEEEFEAAFNQALATTCNPSLLNVHLEPMDSSPAMQRLASHLSRMV